MCYMTDKPALADTREEPWSDLFHTASLLLTASIPSPWPITSAGGWCKDSPGKQLTCSMTSLWILSRSLGAMGTNSAFGPVPRFQRQRQGPQDKSVESVGELGVTTSIPCL